MNKKEDLTQRPASEELPDFTSHELLSAYHDGLRHCVEFTQAEVIPVLNGQFNLKPNEESVLGLFYLIYGLASSGVRLNNKLDFMAVSGTRGTFR